MNHKPSPLISIIVAVFNGAKTLQQCIDSITQQTYPNKELIIIDGGSTDGTVELLKMSHEHIGYWISEPDHGLYSAWNKGLAKANGECICFLGSDDYFWDAQVLERMSGQLEKLPANIRVVYGQVMLLNSEGKELYLSGRPWQKVKNRFRQLMSIPHPGTLHRCSLFEQHGVFDESFRIAGDYELLLRELNSADAEFIPGLITVAMLQGGISSSPQNSLNQLLEVRRAQRMHNQGLPGVYWLMAMSRVYIRLLLWRLLGDELTRKALDLGRQLLGLPTFWTRA